MQSADEFTPSTTEPVFGSGLVNQTKPQSSTNNDASDTEKVTPPVEPVANGPNETTNDKATSNENSTIETVTEKTDAEDLTVVNVNDQSEKSAVETTNEAKQSEEPTVAEKPIVVETPVVSAEAEPVLTTSVETDNEASKAAPSNAIDTTPSPPLVETISDIVPEAPKPTETETIEPKTKSTRGKAKMPVASTSATPTRQSTRGRKRAPSPTDAEKNQTSDDTGASNTTTTTTTATPSEPSKRTKRQAAAIAKDAITASNHPNSTSGSSIADDGNDQDMIPSDGDDYDDVAVGRTKKASPGGRKKRGASASSSPAAKKSRGRSSIVSKSVADNGDKKTETPAKKPRTSSPKKTPEPPSEEYVRKLRSRK